MAPLPNPPPQGGREKPYWLVPVIFLACLIAYYRLAYPLLNDNDVPWHLAAGKLLLATHHLPATDPWAYNNQNQPWVLLSWVWDLILASVLQLFGELGVFIFTITVAAGLTAATTYRLLKFDIAPAAVLLTSIMTGLCLLDYMTARPQLAGYVLAFVFYALTHASRESNGYKYLRWLPLLMLVWTNTHGSFMVGFTILGAYAIDAFFSRRYDWLKRIIITGAACALLGLVNPYGPKVILGMMLSLQSPATRYTNEWQAYAFGTSTGLSLWLMMVLLASNLRGASIFVADKILAVLWLVGMMFAVRNGAIFIILSAPYLATCLDEQTRDFRTPQPETPLARFMSRQKLSHVWAATAAIYVSLCALAEILPHENQILTEDYSSLDAIDFALKNYPDTNFYTDYNFGGPIIYHTGGKLHFFMDSRASTAYSDKDMLDYIEFMRLTDGWEERLREQHFGGLLVAKNSSFAIGQAKGMYHKHWQLVFAGKRANVYISKY